MTAGFEVFVQLVMAAISTAPSRISDILAVDIGGRRATPIAIQRRRFRDASRYVAIGDAERNSVLRALGTRKAGLDGAHVEFQRVVYSASAWPSSRHSPCSRA